MKKIVFSILGLAIIVAVAVFNISVNLRGNPLSDLALANIEALARGEDPGGDADMEICCDNDSNYTCSMQCGCGRWYTTDTKGKPKGMKGTCSNSKCNNTYDDCGK